MSAALEVIAREMYEELFSKGNAAVLDKYVDADFVYQNPMNPVKGRQQIVDLVDAQKVSFEDYRLVVDRVVADQECVAVAWTITGKHVKDFFGYPATNKAISFSGITLHRFADGRSQEAWGYSNMHEVLEL